MSMRSLVAGVFTGLALSMSAFALPVHNVPEGIGRADYVGRVDAAKEMNLTVFLKRHDQAALVLLYQNYPSYQFDELVLPLQGEFHGGAGGGQSIFWSIPSWQNILTGSSRKIPDVSALADPYTGFPIVVSDIKGNQSGEVYGGTSLACPLFSAMWAIANQFAGKSLGQAAPYMYKHGT